MNKALLATISIVFLITGCGTTRLIDSEVRAFAPQPVAPGSRYRFERLPSQQDNAAQDQLEALAADALRQVGLARDDAHADYTVQVSATQRVQTRHERPMPGWNLGWMVGNGGLYVGNGGLFPGLETQTLHFFEVGVIMRQRATQSVVFETRATHDGPWADSTQILPALLQAALQGFPEPPAGVRRVNVEIPR